MSTDIRAAIVWFEPAIDLDTPTESVLQQFDRWQAFVQAVRDADKLATGAVVEWIKVHGPLDAGQVVYWIGHERITRCTDTAATVEALFQATGGDVEQFAACLSANAIKPGASRKVLAPDVHDTLFRTETRDKLESGEALPKRLQRTEKRFLEQ